MKSSQDPKTTPTHQRIYDVVKQIPAGKVATYGQIAHIAKGCTARMVGYAMASLRRTNEDVPWQRVINSKGKINPHGEGFGSMIQRELLEDEGIVFDAQDRINLSVYRWDGMWMNIDQEKD